MLEPLRSPDPLHAAQDPAEALLRRIVADTAIRWDVPDARNDPVCESDEPRETRAALAQEATLHAGLGHFATTDAPLFDGSVSYATYEAARARRARMQALLLRKAAGFVREAMQKLWARYRRHREMRIIRDSLQNLDDRTLLDLGFHRSEILSVAAEAAGLAERTRVLPRTPS